MLNLFVGLDIYTGLLLLLALAFVLFYEAINGFHDTANAVAAVIYTRAMQPQLAVVMAAFFNFFGVLLGGLSVAYAIVHMLPTDLLLNMGSTHGLAMVFSMLLAAIIWNLGTWFFGLPASSSHTLIGAIIGIGLTNALLTGSSVMDALNLREVTKIFSSLIVSPIVGLVIAGGLIFLLRRYWSGTKKRDRIHRIPEDRKKKKGKRKPPFWTRIALIVSAAGVAFSHGANDGQKGIGLVMLVLVGIAPAGFVVNMNASGYEITRNHGGVMALFYYQALERNGRKTKGMIEADSARHARQLLRGKELIPVHIEARMNTSSGGMLQRRRHAHRRVAAADLALFTRQLATLVQAAMPLETCLQAVSEQSEKLHVKSLGMALRSRIQEGYTLSDSLREHPRVFDSLFCSMVAAGEKSGHLDVVLNRLADYTEQRQRLKSRLLQAMLYPLVLLVVATGVVTILLTAVVPKIIEQFDHLGHALPVSTRTLIAMSDALQASGVYWLAGLLGLLVLGQRLLKNPAMRLRWDKTLLRLPVIGRVARGLNTARFSRTLSILTASSVPLLEGIQTAAAVSANRYVEQQLLLAADRVREGSSLRAALAELRLFPPMMLYMIASGEQSGELETMLEQAAVNQEREFDTQVGLALGLFEPALVVMMAGVVLFIVIAILEPMLQLNNMVGM